MLCARTRKAAERTPTHTHTRVHGGSIASTTSAPPPPSCYHANCSFLAALIGGDPHTRFNNVYFCAPLPPSFFHRQCINNESHAETIICARKKTKASEDTPFLRFLSLCNYHKGLCLFKTHPIDFKYLP